MLRDRRADESERQGQGEEQSSTHRISVAERAALARKAGCARGGAPPIGGEAAAYPPIRTTAVTETDRPGAATVRTS